MEERSTINIEIPEALRRQVKAQAALMGVTISEYVSSVLQAEIAADRQDVRRDVTEVK